MSYKTTELEGEQASKLYNEIYGLSFIKLEGKNIKDLRKYFFDISKI